MITVLEKSAFGEPCNGCGLCCKMERCAIADMLIGEGPGPCPALEFEEGRYWCGIVRNASRYTDQVEPAKDEWFGWTMKRLYFGTGCDFELGEVSK